MSFVGDRHWGCVGPDLHGDNSPSADKGGGGGGRREGRGGVA